MSMPSPAAIAAVVGDCLLCEGPRYVLGCFAPDDPARWTPHHKTTKEGKTRTIWYALCKPCSEREDAPDAVEQEILRRNAGAQN